MSLDELEPVDSVLTFLSGYDTLEYSWVKATAVCVRSCISFVTLQNTNKDSEENYDDNIADFEDEPMDDAEEMDEAGENAAEDQPPDELGQVLVDSQRDSETLKESKKFEKMLEDHKKLLYPDYKQGLKKLSFLAPVLWWLPMYSWI